MTQLTTPYNFVPLSSTVFFPPWAKDSSQLSHDAPLRDGWCGTLRIRITAHTPLLVAGTQTGAQRHPYKVHNTFAVPGSSLRGMVRNVLEIATFGKFGRAINDREMSMRDVTPKSPYMDMINARTVRAGWLQFAADNTKSFATLQPVGEPKRLAKEKVDAVWQKSVAGGGNPYALQKAEVNPITQRKEMWSLVKTGDVHGKKEEFLFRVTSEAPPLPVSHALFQQFAAAHQHNELWANKQGEPGPLQKRLMQGLPIPVFYIADPKSRGQVRAFGLAYMFRVPYRNSLHEAVGFTSTHHHDASQLDFCEALFGLIHDGEDGHPTSLRSRVGFGLATATHATAHQGPGMAVVLNEPKPSFYPAYMKGGQTLMANKPELAGWKRYPVRSQAAPQNTNANGNQNIGSQLFPLQKGATFEGDITLHNVHPQELGGLLWALTWGQQPHLRHSLGMGRPFGLGSVQVEVLGMDLRHNADSSQDIRAPHTAASTPATVAQALPQLMAAFTSTMQTAVKGWESTEQLKELQAMANPALGDQAAPTLKYMPLDNFRAVKGGKGNTAQTLKPFSVLAGGSR
jgi:hypothetical protein